MESMEFYERDFFVSRLLAGYIKIDFNKIMLYVHSPTVDLNYESQEIFKQAYDEAFMSGIFTRKELYDYRIENDLWSRKEEADLEKLDKKIDDLKLDLYNNYINPVKREAYRSLLREEEDKKLKLFTKQHSYDHVDCEGVGTYARLNWLIQNTTKLEDGSLYDFEEIDVATVLQRWQGELLKDAQAREIARTEPWRSNWSCSKQLNILFRASSPAELNPDQKTVLAYSQMYDNINEAAETPVNAVIEDDDALDGWLIKQRRASDKRRKETSSQDVLSQHSSADEVYIFSEGKEEAEAIYDLNDPDARYAVAQREGQLERDGEVGYTQFQDVKMRVNEELNEMMKARR